MARRSAGGPGADSRGWLVAEVNGQLSQIISYPNHDPFDFVWINVPNLYDRPPANYRQFTIALSCGVHFKFVGESGCRVIGLLNPGISLPVTGRNAGGDWYAVNLNGQQGWVSAAVVVTEGDCASLPVLQLPAGQNTPQSPAATQEVAPPPRRRRQAL